MRLEDCDTRELQGCAPIWFVMLIVGGAFWAAIIGAIIYFSRH